MNYRLVVLETPESGFTSSVSLMQILGGNLEILGRQPAEDDPGLKLHPGGVVDMLRHPATQHAVGHMRMHYPGMLTIHMSSSTTRSV